MNAHRGVKSEASVFRCLAYIICLALLGFALLVPGFEPTSPYLEALGDLPFVEVKKSGVTYTLMDICKENNVFSFIYLFICFTMLVCFFTGMNYKRVPVLPRFCIAIVSLCLLTILTLFFHAALDRITEDIYFKTSVLLKSSMGVYVVYFSCGLALLTTYCEIWSFYRFYPVQTLFWALCLFVVGFIGTLIYLPLVLLGINVFLSLSLSWVITFIALVSIVIWKGSKWNARIRGRIAEKRNDALYLGYGKTFPAEKYSENVNGGLYGSDASASNIVTYEDDEDDSEKDNKTIWIVVGISIVAIFIICYLIFRNPTASSNDSLFSYNDSLSSHEEITLSENGNSSADNDEEVVYEEIEENDNVSFEEPINESSYEEKETVEIVHPIEGAIAVTGKLDGKYGIVMQFSHPDDSGIITGEYYYIKYKVPIALSGMMGEDGIIRLEEITNGNLTGRFIGKMTREGFDGIWESADGTKTMTCQLENIE